MPTLFHIDFALKIFQIKCQYCTNICFTGITLAKSFLALSAQYCKMSIFQYFMPLFSGMYQYSQDIVLIGSNILTFGQFIYYK